MADDSRIAANVEAEESVLGAMLLAPRAIEVSSEFVQARDFYRETYGRMFAVMVEMHDRQMPVDPLTVSGELQRLGILEACGGNSKLAEIAALVPSTSNVGHYARLVREAAVQRRLVDAGLEIARLGREGVGTQEEIVEKAEAYLTDALSDSLTANAHSITDGLEEWLAELRVAFETGSPIRGHQTLIGPLDSALGGLWPGQLVLAAARPSIGKSTFALNIADNMADTQKHVLIASLEMSRHELRIRSLSRLAEVDSLRLQAGTLDSEEAKRLGKAVPLLRNRERYMHVLDEGTTSLSNIRAEANRLKRHGDFGAIVVDYIQLMSPPAMSARASRAEQIGSISRGLKQLAQRLNVPILALSQMNRNIEARHVKRPTLSDLRESGTLEQDADVVIFLHNEADFDDSKDSTDDLEFIIAKARRGASVSSFKLKYDKPLNRFGTELV